VPNNQFTLQSFIRQRCGGRRRNVALLAKGQNLFPMPSGFLFHLSRPGSVGRQSESAEDGHFESVLVHQVLLVVVLEKADTGVTDVAKSTAVKMAVAKVKLGWVHSEYPLWGIEALG
jgi:hypothetical protein